MLAGIEATVKFFRSLSQNRPSCDKLNNCHQHLQMICVCEGSHMLFDALAATTVSKATALATLLGVKSNI